MRPSSAVGGLLRAPNVAVELIDHGLPEDSVRNDLLARLAAVAYVRPGGAG